MASKKKPHVFDGPTLRRNARERSLGSGGAAKTAKKTRNRVSRNESARKLAERFNRQSTDSNN